MRAKDQKLIEEAYTEMYNTKLLNENTIRSTNTKGFYTETIDNGDYTTVIINHEKGEEFNKFLILNNSDNAIEYDEQKRVIFMYIAGYIHDLSYRTGHGGESILNIIKEHLESGEIVYDRTYTDSYDDNGNLSTTYYSTDHPENKGTTVYDKNGNVIAHHTPEYSVEYVEGKKVKEIRNLNEPNQKITTYDPADESVTSIETTNTLTVYKDGLPEYTIDKKTGVKTGATPYINKAVQKAQKYMDTFHGMFFHAFGTSDLDNLLKLKHQEVCVSTVRSNTVFIDPSEDNSIVLIGFGDITQLYDFDAFSWKTKSGKRVSTHDPGGEGLFDIDKSRVSDYVDSKYYDEGFMPWGSADVLLACVYQDEYTTNIIKKLRSAYPGIKVIKPENFSKIKSSEQLLRVLYRLRDERDAKELMKEPLHKYEESIKYLQCKI